MNLSPQKGSAWQTVLYCGLIVIISLPVQYVIALRGDTERRLLGTLDSWSFFAPYAFLLDTETKAGRIPLWNPLTLCGQPFAANPQAAVFYPPNLLRSLLGGDGTPWGALLSLKVMVLFHVAVAFAGMFALVRDHRLSRGASVIGTLPFAYCFLFVRTGMFGSWVILSTYTWFPWLLLFTRRLLMSRKPVQRTLWVLMIGVAYGLTLLSGYPQIALYVAGTLGLYVVVYHLVLRMTPSQISSGEALLGTRDSVVSLAAAFAVAGALACVLLVPAAELSGWSSRGRESLMAVNDRNANPIVLLSLHVKIGVLLLLSLSVTQRNTKEVLLWAMLLLAGFLSFCGSKVSLDGVLRALAPFQFGSFHSSLPLVLLPLGLLAGFGYEGLFRRARSEGYAWKQSLIVFLGGLFLIFLYRQGPERLQILPQHPLPNLAALFAVTSISVARLAPLRGWRILVPLCLVLETVTLNAWAMDDWKAERLDFPGVPRTLRDRPNWSRSNTRATTRGNLSMYRLEYSMTGYEPAQLAATRQILSIPGEELEYKRFVYPSTLLGRNERMSLFLKRRFWLAKQYVKGPLPSKEIRFAPTETVFLSNADVPVIPVVNRKDLLLQGVSSNSTVEDITYRLTELNSTEETDVSVLGIDLQNASGRHSALRLHYRADWGDFLKLSLYTTLLNDPVSEMGMPLSPTGKNVLVAELPLPDVPRLQGRLSIGRAYTEGHLQFLRAEQVYDESDETGLIAITSSQADSVELSVGPLPGSRLLVFVESFYPGWSAYLDGMPTPILQANDAFQAIVLSPGTHRVRFEFDSRSVRIGLMITALSGCLVAGAFTYLLLGRQSEARKQAQ